MSDNKEKDCKILTYPEAARVIALYLSDYCDEKLPYSNMIAEASRRASEYIKSQQWISIEDRLPEDSVTVYVKCSDGLYPLLAEYSSKKYFLDNYDDENYMEEGFYPSNGFYFDLPEVLLDSVTHWKPNSENPEEK